MTSDPVATAAVARKPRPLSPHLQIYRWQHTMLTSILHRATGIALSAGVPVLVWWLYALAAGEDQYRQVQHCLGSAAGLFCLVGWSWSFFYHLSAGLRHLTWDTGRGLEIKTTRITSPIVIAASVLLTALFWGALFARGSL